MRTALRWGLLLTLGAAAVVSLAADARETTARESDIVFHKDVVFGKAGGKDLTLNLAAPAEARSPLPAVVVLHGGLWIAGDKARHDNLVRWLARQGYVAVTVGYRKLLRGTTKWPAPIEDAKCAVRWLRAHAARLRVDPGRIAAVGLSSGAHLAMLLGTTDRSAGFEGNGGHARYSSRVQAVVSFFGPTDLSTIHSQAAHNSLQAAAARNMLESQFHDTRHASPVAHVTQGDAPMLLFQGTKDHLVPYQQAVAMLERSTQAGVDTEVVFLAGKRHGWRDPHLTATIDAALHFLDRHLRPGRIQSKVHVMER